MRKIISLFQRNYETDRLARNEVVPGAEWVLAGEGIATQKHDGTSCMMRDGVLYKRYDAKAFTIEKGTGKRNEWGRACPEGFIPAQDPDPITGHWPGWVAVSANPADQWHREAFADFGTPKDGTYELCGPKIQGNPEVLPKHLLIPHGLVAMHDAPRDFDGIRAFLAQNDIEGIVWHHPDGRMVKTKQKDFGLKRQRKI